jgi:hypothetical protein
MKRILIIVGMLALAGLAFGIPGLIAAAPTIEDAEPEPAILSEIVNDVAVRAHNEADWERVTTVGLVGDGASVRTQADSKARLDLPNGNVLWIGSDTTFELSNIDGQDWAIFLEQGAVMLEVPADNLGRSIIVTPIGAAWPTGSILGVDWSPPNGTAGTLKVGCFDGLCQTGHFTFYGRYRPSSIENGNGNEVIDAVPAATLLLPYFEIPKGHDLTIQVEKPQPMDPQKWEPFLVDLGNPKQFTIDGDPKLESDQVPDEAEQPDPDDAPAPEAEQPAEDGACTIEVVQNLFCRLSPGYAEVDSFTAGTKIDDVVGISPDGLYAFVTGPNQRVCTIPIGGTYAELSSGCDLPVLTLMPPPTATPTPTFTPTPEPTFTPSPTPMPSNTPTISPTP